MEPLALTVATLLAREAVKRTGDLAGEAISGFTGKLVELVRRRFHDDTDASEAWESVRRDPGSKERITALASHVERHLSGDGEFTRSLREVMAAAEDDPDTWQVLMTIKDNASVGKIANFGTVEGDVSF